MRHLVLSQYQNKYLTEPTHSNDRLLLLFSNTIIRFNSFQCKTKSKIVNKIIWFSLYYGFLGSEGSEKGNGLTIMFIYYCFFFLFRGYLFEFLINLIDEFPS